MAISVVSAPVSHPGGVRMTTGLITFDSSYDAGGEAVTPAQFGGGQDGIPNQLPDFVVINFIAKAGGGTPTAVAPYATYDKLNGLIHVYTTAFSGNQGVAEVPALTNYSTAKATFLALWLQIGAQAVV